MVNKTADFEHCYLCHECIVIFLILNTFTTKVGGEFKWSSQRSLLLPDWATAVLNLPARLKFLVAPGKQATVNVEHCYYYYYYYYYSQLPLNGHLYKTDTWSWSLPFLRSFTLTELSLRRTPL